MGIWKIRWEWDRRENTLTASRKCGHVKDRYKPVASGNFQESARMTHLRLLAKGDTQPKLDSSCDIIR